MAYQGYSNTDFERTMHTILARNIAEVEVNVLRNYAMGALLESGGRVIYRCTGRGMDWPVQYKLHDVQGYTGEETRTYGRDNLWKTANLEYRGYQATQGMYKKEFREAAGQEAIVKVFDGMVDRLKTSLKQHFGKQYYIDGSANGNETCWHGLESMFGTNGTVTYTTGAQQSTSVQDYVAYPSDTYAGLSTILGNYGGENASGSIWPADVADAEYDFWSPLIVQYDSARFGGSANTFAKGVEAMRYAILNGQRNASMDLQLTTFFLARNLYGELLNLLDDKEQIQITSENGLRALGFKNVVVVDGVEVTWETGVAQDTGYGVNINGIELCSMYDDSLFDVEGPTYDPDESAFKASVDTLSNLKFKNGPRNFVKITRSALVV